MKIQFSELYFIVIPSLSNNSKLLINNVNIKLKEAKVAIKNGVKECIPSRTPLYNPMDFSVQYRENHRLDDVASVLEKGIKETWGYEKQPQKRIDEVIMNGQKD